ncbi:MAG TPA: guanylate kinase [Acidobacteriaceae bacterium]|nr:guanylate kinase [Acidobacteriaceae bacterium]
MSGILFIISAPSGSGKSTLVNQLRSLVSGLEFSVSWTTRGPRGSEVDSREYHFTTREHFEEMIRNGEFLEHAQVFGNYYGTAKSTLKEAFAQGKDLLLDIDVQGAAQVRTKCPDAVSIFLMPPSPEVLATRLRNRSRAEGAVQEEIIERRLGRALVEIENYREYGYILVNDVLDRAVEEMVAIVAAERVRRSGDTSLSATDSNRVLALAESCRQANSQSRIRTVLRAFGVQEPGTNGQGHA